MTMSKSGRDEGRRERAAAIQAEQARAERNRKLALYGAVVVVVAVIAAAVFWYSGGSSSNPTSAADAAKVPARVVGMSGAPATTIATKDASAGSTPNLVIGKASAPTKVVVYEDFLCPYCREFEEASRDFLHEAAEQGKVEVEYRPFHLLQPQYSLDALNAFAAVLTSSSPEVALRFHDLLYDKQPYETASSFPDASELAKWAKSVGGDSGAVEAAVNANDPAFAKAAEELSTAAKVPGTPTVFVDGKTLSGSSPADMANKLQTMIGK
jgi:protein-disulfide isomerase